MLWLTVIYINHSHQLDITANGMLFDGSNTILRSRAKLRNFLRTKYAKRVIPDFRKITNFQTKSLANRDSYYRNSYCNSVQ